MQNTEHISNWKSVDYCLPRQRSPCTETCTPLEAVDTDSISTTSPRCPDLTTDPSKTSGGQPFAGTHVAPRSVDRAARMIHSNHSVSLRAFPKVLASAVGKHAQNDVLHNDLRPLNHQKIRRWLFFPFQSHVGETNHIIRHANTYQSHDNFASHRKRDFHGMEWFTNVSGIFGNIFTTTEAMVRHAQKKTMSEHGARRGTMAQDPSAWVEAWIPQWIARARSPTTSCSPTPR